MNSENVLQEKFEIAQSQGGANHFYGLRMRPYSLGAQPKGSNLYLDPELAITVFDKLKDKVNCRHGVLAYPSVITDDVCDRMDLIPLDFDKQAEFEVDIFTGDLNEESLADQIAKLYVDSEHQGKQLTYAQFDDFAALYANKDISSMNKWFRKHPVFLERKTNKTTFDKFQSLREKMSVEDIANAICDNHLR